MMVRHVRSALWLAALLVAAPALAAVGDEVGKITVLAGAGSRVGPDGTKPLAKDLSVRVGDEIVLTSGAAKITLNDESTLNLAVADKGEKKATLKITEADFENQVRKGFIANLGVGKLWAKVKKAVAGSEAKFEVTTDRAVAGVRGTIFRVDAVQIVKGTKPAKKSTTVWVKKGLVGVASTGKVKEAPPPTGKRVQVSGPKEITKEEWEKKFAELQAGMSVTVDEELWTMKPAPEPQDALAAFVKQHDDTNDE